MELLRGQSLEQRLIESQVAQPRARGGHRSADLARAGVCARARCGASRSQAGQRVSGAAGDETVAKLLDFGIAKVRASSEFQSLDPPGHGDGHAGVHGAGASVLRGSGQLQERPVLGGGDAVRDAERCLAGGRQRADGRGSAGAHRQGAAAAGALSRFAPGALESGASSHAARCQQRPESALAMRRELSAFAGELSSAGRLASAVSRDESRAGRSDAGGTQKVRHPSSASRARHRSARCGVTRGADDGRDEPVWRCRPGSRCSSTSHTAAAGPAAIAAAAAAKAAARACAVLACRTVPCPRSRPAPAAVPAPAGSVLLLRCPPRSTAPDAEMPRVDDARALPATDPPPIPTCGRKRGGSLWLWLTLCGSCSVLGVGVTLDSSGHVGSRASASLPCPVAARRPALLPRRPLLAGPKTVAATERDRAPVNAERCDSSGNSFENHEPQLRAMVQTRCLAMTTSG